MYEFYISQVKLVNYIVDIEYSETKIVINIGCKRNTCDSSEEFDALWNVKYLRCQVTIIHHNWGWIGSLIINVGSMNVWSPIECCTWK